MTDNERFRHFCKKFHEVLHLSFNHYEPLGKPLPPHYYDVFYEIYKIFDSGVLDELAREPISEEIVQQLDIFDLLTKSQKESGGTLFDPPKAKKP